MDKEIICVYQDCLLCGDRGAKLKKLIFSEKLNVRKVSFVTPEGRHLIHEAVFNHKMGALPFFTDGKKFSYKLSDFIKQEEKKPAKKSRRSGKNKKVEVKDGDNK